jgi:beta-propeller repeat-containing protein/ASPM-SPD-2-Hydin domain-containing protein/HYDIN/CFA65/VesB family protein
VVVALVSLALAGAALISVQANFPGPANARVLASPGLAARRKPSLKYARQPLRFEENHGQTNGRVDFLARGLGYTVFLTRQGVVLSLSSGQKSNVKSQKSLATRHSPLATDVVRLNLVGANPAAKVTGLEELPGKANYFIGNDPAKWRRDVPTFAKVKYEGAYPGVDLVYYGNAAEGGKLEYDFVVKPGADLKAITLDVDPGGGGRRAVPLHTDRNGDLVVETHEGEVRFHKPVVYQQESGVSSQKSEEEQVATDNGPRTTNGINRQSAIGNRQFLDGRYVLRAGKRVGFEVPGYDKTRPLIIDPVLDYSTYLGGSGGDVASGVAVDGAANAYVTGATGSTNFPITSAEQATIGGNTDAFVTKFDPSGALVYSTYLGGAGADAGTGIAVDPKTGIVTIIGNTTSLNFPTTTGALQTTYGGLGDAFVARLSATGTTLVYSTYLGGSDADFGQGIALDSSGNAYLTGATRSTNFPVASPFQIGLNGSSDAFVCKLNFVPGTGTGTGLTLVYSTYLGGSGGDSGQGIAVDSSGDAYVTGFTSSTNFPTQSAFQSANGGGTDAFVSEFTPDGSSLLFSTYLGGSAEDRAFGIALDSVGGIYLTGDTQSLNFPVTSGAFQTLYNGGGDAFVAKISSGGTGITYATFLGGTESDQGTAIAVDGAGEAAVTGITESSNFPLVDPFQKIPGITGAGSCGTSLCSDAFVVLFDASGAPVYSTYLGGSGNDIGQAVAVDASAGVYVAGGTASVNFPVIAGAAQSSYAGTGTSGNAFVVKVLNVDSPAVALTPQQINFGNQALNTPSAPQMVSLINEGSADLSISSIVAIGDFSQTNNCGTVVPAGGGACAIQVTFTPTSTASETDQIAINDNAGGSPQVITVTGAGSFPPTKLTVSPTSLTFPPTAINSTATAQTVLITNTGDVAVQLTNISATTGFAETNTCGTLPAELNVSASCSVSVTFTPTKAGSVSGTLVITDSTGTAHSITLAGSGITQFSLSANPTSSVLLIGTATTTFTLSASAVSSFTSAISLSCSAGSSGARCSFNPASINPGQTSTLTLKSLSASTPNPLSITVTGTASGQSAGVTLTLFFSDFTLTPSPLNNSVRAGQSTTYTVTVTPSNGFNQVVLLSCGPLPQDTTCTWSPPGVIPNGPAAVTSTLTVATTSQITTGNVWRLARPRNNPPWRGEPWVLWIAAGLVVLAFVTRAAVSEGERRGRHARRRLRWGLLGWAVAISFLLFGLGCQTYYNGLSVTPAPVGTPSGNYQILVIGTLGSNGTVQRATSVNLAVGPG